MRLSPKFLPLRPAWTLLLLVTSVQVVAATQLVLSDVTIIDPTHNGRQRAHRDILIVHKKIVAVYRHGHHQFGNDAQVLQLTGKYVLPGLVDMHVHSRLSPRGEDGRLIPHASPSTTRALMRSLLALGVTTIRDPGGPTAELLQLRSELQQGVMIGPTMYTAGQILNTTAPGPEFIRVTDPTEACSEINRQREAGVDLIKIYSGFDETLTAAAIQCGHCAGLPVIGHLQRTTWTAAAQAGIDGIEHSAPWSADYLPEKSRSTYDGSLFGRVQWLREVDLASPALSAMRAALKDHYVTVDPTLIATRTKFWGNDKQYVASPDLQFAPAEYRNGWKHGSFTANWTDAQYTEAQNQWPKQLDLVHSLYRAGIPLTVGTDTPTPWIIPGVSVHQEMQLLHSAGLSPAAVLQSATVNAARVLHREHEIGQVSPGFYADVVILDKNPLKNITNTRAIHAVVKRGHLYKPQDLLTMNGEVEQ